MFFARCYLSFIFLSYKLLFSGFLAFASLQWAASHCTWAYVNSSIHQILL